MKEGGRGSTKLLCKHYNMLCGTQVAGEDSLVHNCFSFVDQENNNLV